MLIHWYPLLGGLLLGLIPPRLLINSEVRYLRFDAVWQRITAPANVRQRRRRWWKLPLVWIDPVRGYVVADLLHGALRAQPGARGLDTLWPLLLTLLFLFVVLISQTGGRESAGETLSPCGFLAGMLIALLPWIVALSAIALGATAAVAMGRFIAGYLTSTFVTACLGYIFLSLNPWLLGCTLLVATPMLISWFRRRSLVIPMRA